MSELILHHYAMSPFSEKVRLMLGAAGLGWRSVVVAEMPPRPHLKALAGGYRRIPVAQSGADIFCDSRIISTEIAELASRPALSHQSIDPSQQALVNEAELEVFLACILSADGKTLFGQLRRNTSTLHVLRFLWDRINMGRKASVKAAGPRQAKQVVRDYLARLEDILVDDFLTGQQPTIVDFAGYHGLWFVRDLGGSSIVSRYPKVDAWMNRMGAMGHGRPTEITIDQALADARTAEPRTLPAAGLDEPLLGKSVSVAPTDYGRDQVTGLLVASNQERWILQREHELCGRVHVHFPKQGFALREVH